MCGMFLTSPFFLHNAHIISTVLISVPTAPATYTRNTGRKGQFRPVLEDYFSLPSAITARGCRKSQLPAACAFLQAKY